MELIFEYLVNIHYQKEKNFLKRMFKMFVYYFKDILYPIKGLYIWGGVGRGKTWLLDLFYTYLPINRKLRLHFHSFMSLIHQKMIKLQGKKNPLKKIAQNFKSKIDILCFDEFFVSDITDAMLLSVLLKEFFNMKIILIITSNFHPDNLYFKGTNRSYFLPTIQLIKNNCKIMNINCGIDYRKNCFFYFDLWIYPLNKNNTDLVREKFFFISGKKLVFNKKNIKLTINNRILNVIGYSNTVVAVNFYDLCINNCSQNDYITLSKKFFFMLLYNVRKMDDSNKDIVRRFIFLIDQLYEYKVKLIVTAEKELEFIYVGKELYFEYQRCLSRLYEMQSEEYIKRDFFCFNKI